MDIDTIDGELREAILSRDVISVRRLLAAGAALDYYRVSGATPLHFCLKKYCWTVDENILLARKYTRDKEIEIIRELIESVNGDNDILDCFDDDGESPLTEAINCGDLETVEILVRAGASIEKINRADESALHIATRAQQHRVLKYFLDNHDIPNSTNKYNITPMHFSAISGKVESMKLLIEKFGDKQLTKRNYEGRTVWHEIAGWHAIEIAQYLLRAGDCRYRSDLNLLDNEGNTPVFLAARQGDAAMTALLLRNGAALAARRITESVIKEISKEFTNPLTFLKEIFDDCVYETKKCVNVDYKVLTDSESSDIKGMSQIKVIEELVRWGQSNLLKHPMIESLIYLKWECLLPVFYIIVATYATFLGTFTFFVVKTFNEIDSKNRTQDKSMSTNDVPLVEGCGRRHWTLVVFIYMSISVLFFQECVWIRLRKLRYLAHREPWVKLFGLASAALVPVLVDCAHAPAPAPAPSHWQRYVACAALLLAWLQAMLLLSRFPDWGYYVLMFERVAINVLKVIHNIILLALTSLFLEVGQYQVIGGGTCLTEATASNPPERKLWHIFGIRLCQVLLTSICLVVGFSVCFMILYQSKPPFDGFVAAFVKTLVMMLSEFDYEDLFGDEHAEIEDTRPFARLLFVTFVIFIAIVMMNFMIGIAVSDISELSAIGNVRRLEKQVELLSTLEGLGDTVLAKWWKRLSRIRYHSDIGRSLADQGRRWFVEPDNYNRDYNYFRQTFTPELHNAICDLARKKKQDLNKLDALYDAMVGAPHNNKRHTDTRSGDQEPPVLTFKDRIKSIEDVNQEIKQSIDDLKKINNLSTEEMKQYIDELRKDINMILRIVAQSIHRTSPRYLVSRKRQLRNKRKKIQ